MIHRNYFVNAEWKHQILPNTENMFFLKYNSDKYILEIRSDQIVFFMMLQHPELHFSDNGFTLMPNETKKVNVQGSIHRNFCESEIKISVSYTHLTLPTNREV